MNRLNFNNGTALVIGLLLAVSYQLDRHNRQSTKSNKTVIVRQESNQIFEQWQVKEGSVDDGNTLTIQRGEEELKVRLCGIKSRSLEQPLGIEAREHLQLIVNKNKGNLLVTRAALTWK